MKRKIAFLVCAVMVFSLVLSGCTKPGFFSAGTSDLMLDIKPQAKPAKFETLGGELAAAPTGFSVELFKNSLKDEGNTLISPVSVLCALAMTANGAKGETLSELESVFGMTVEELNAYIKAYMDVISSSERNRISLANSIWFINDERFSVNRSFLQTDADYYGADIYSSPFDAVTLKAINSWVEDKTEGMIEDILSEINIDAVMYLVNAVAFDAEWQDPYRDAQVRDGVFTKENGERQDAELMYSSENVYLDDGLATGFMKHYIGSDYAFVALLPNEGVSIRDYVDSLSGESLARLLSKPQYATVHAALPKFESDYSVSMQDILKEMGIVTAFDENAADFSGLGSSTAGNIFINSVIHKSYIAVDEKGTKAGAATIVEVDAKSAMPTEPKEVILDRPFVYMIVDCEANLPLFIGTMTDLG